MAQLAVIVMCPSDRDPRSAMRLFAAAATKRLTAQKADYVPGNISGEFGERGFIKAASWVRARLNEAIER